MLRAIGGNEERRRKHAMPTPETADPRLKRLIDLSAPLWAGEAEVARTYFNGSGRTAATDRKWLAHQCYKEFFGSGFVDPERGILREWGQKMVDMRPELDRGLDRHVLLDLVEAVYAEYHHYCLFADIYDSLGGPGDAKLAPHMLANWPEGEALDGFRLRMRKDHGEIAQAALSFTEGGYCTLYSEGARLAGRGGVDDRIAAACRRVYDDEVGHMMKGIVGVRSLALDDAGWALIEDLVVRQLRLRVEMRNGQFSHPLSPRRIAAIFAGDIEPIAFDWTLAAKAA
jgi:hypothetical protein